MRNLTKTDASKKSLVINVLAIKKAGTLYRAIYHPLRIKIIEQIYKAERISVSKLGKKLKEDKAHISQQLKILRDAAIVDTERRGSRVFYSVNNKQLEKIQTQSARLVSIPATKPVTISKKELHEIRQRVVKPKESGFTDKELQIIQFIYEQKTSEEIAAKLKLSKRTIEDYRLKIIKKMKMRNTVGLVIYAIENNMVKRKL